MNINSNYSVFGCGFNRLFPSKRNTAFSGLFSRNEPKDTDMMPWGRTWGEHKASLREAAATKRMIQRETLKKSEDPSVREAAERVGENPFIDEYLTQREFDKYHEKEMAKRAAIESQLLAAAGKKQYDNLGGYIVKDKKGRIIERGKNDTWDTKYEYDIKYPVNRFGERYTMNEAVKETKPDNTYIIRVSPYSNGRLEEMFPNKSIEYVDNCTGMIKSVKLPNGESFSLPNRLINVKRTDHSRQYFSQYNDKSVLLEVFDDGNYIKK